MEVQENGVIPGPLSNMLSRGHDHKGQKQNVSTCMILITRVAEVVMHANVKDPDTEHVQYMTTLTPVLDKISTADALILGTPIFYGSATGEMRSFLERLLFPRKSWG